MDQDIVNGTRSPIHGIQNRDCACVPTLFPPHFIPRQTPPSTLYDQPRYSRLGLDQVRSTAKLGKSWCDNRPGLDKPCIGNAHGRYLIIMSTVSIYGFPAPLLHSSKIRSDRLRHCTCIRLAQHTICIKLRWEPHHTAAEPLPTYLFNSYPATRLAPHTNEPHGHQRNLDRNRTKNRKQQSDSNSATGTLRSRPGDSNRNVVTPGFCHGCCWWNILIFDLEDIQRFFAAEIQCRDRRS